MRSRRKVQVTLLLLVAASWTFFGVSLAGVHKVRWANLGVTIAVVALVVVFPPTARGAWYRELGLAFGWAAVVAGLVIVLALTTSMPNWSILVLALALIVLGGLVGRRLRRSRIG